MGLDSNWLQWAGTQDTYPHVTFALPIGTQRELSLTIDEGN